MGSKKSFRKTHRIRVDDLDLAPPLAQLLGILRIRAVRNTQTQDPVVNLACLYPTSFGERVGAVEFSRDGDGLAVEGGRNAGRSVGVGSVVSRRVGRGRDDEKTVKRREKGVGTGKERVVFWCCRRRPGELESSAVHDDVVVRFRVKRFDL